jgi:hypothetical protein
MDAVLPEETGAAMSKKRELPRLERWLIISYVLWLLVGTTIGIWINGRIAAIERGESSNDSSQEETPW